MSNKGGYGESWFKVDLSSGYVPNDSRNIYLDTTPPQTPTFIVNNGEGSTNQQLVTAHLGHSDRVISGYQIKIWGSVDSNYDPNIKATEEASEWVAFSPTRIFKLSQYNGSKTLHAKIRDDVWNETAALTVTIALTGQTDPPPITPNKGGDAAPSFTGAPIIGEEFEQKWSSEFDTRLPVINLARVNGTAALVKTVTVTASAQVSAFRNVEFRASGTRMAATRWNRIIEEDEELILSL
jgi:hypothetical protein